jgi:hypothetical protein
MDENLPSQTIRNVPSELSASVPRKVGLSESSRSMPIVLALLIGATVVSLSLYGKHVVSQMQQRSVLRAEGVEAQAEIASLIRAYRGPDVVHYTFTADGRKISGLADVPPKLLRSLRESTFLAVRYLPSNPSVNHPAAWEWSLSSEWLAIVILMTLPILCAVTIPDAYINRQVLVWGTPVTGLVTRCTRERGVYTVKYEFHTKTGELVKGSGQSPGRREVGERIWILFLTQNPRRNRPYPFSDFCVEE